MTWIAGTGRGPWLVLLVCIGMALLAPAADAGTIMVTGDSNIGAADNGVFFSNVFGGADVLTNIGSAGTYPWTLTNWSGLADDYADSWTVDTSTVTASGLAGIEWFVTSGEHAFSAAEVAALSTYLGQGGNLFLVGEGGFYATINTNASALLSDLGSSMSVGGVAKASGGHLAYRPFGEVATDAFTTGVTRFYGDYAGVVSGGTALFTESGKAWLAYETVGAAPVPEPATLALVAIGVGAFAALRRPRRRRIA